MMADSRPSAPAAARCASSGGDALPRPRHPLGIPLVDLCSPPEPAVFIPSRPRHPLGIPLLDIYPPPDPAAFIPPRLRDPSGDVPRRPCHPLVALRPVDPAAVDPPPCAPDPLPTKTNYDEFILKNPPPGLILLSECETMPVLNRYVGPGANPFLKNLWKKGCHAHFGSASLPKARETSVPSFPVGGTAADVKSSFPADVKDLGCDN